MVATSGGAVVDQLAQNCELEGSNPAIAGTGRGRMEQCALQNVNNCLNTNIYSYLETSGGQSSNVYLNVVQFFNTSVD
jgi:hypothetical protein